MKHLKILILSLFLFASTLAAQTASVGLGWDPSPTTDVAKYNIYSYALGVTNKTSVAALPSGNTATVSNLVYGTTYSFYATAENSVLLESDPSNVIQWTPLIGIPPNNNITGYSIGSYKAGSWQLLSLTWTAIANKSQYGFTNYNVVIANLDLGTTQTFTTPTNTYTFPTLPVANYQISIVSTNLIGSSSTAGTASIFISNKKPLPLVSFKFVP